MKATDLPGASWRKSSRSGDNFNCVEVARSGSVVGIRDSKDPGGDVLAVSASAFRSFVAGLRSGRVR
ncbi:uncharacterized protein DUF397 [Saccharopolyspora erythraea NRRL 2338]|uniref:Regulator n=2 Tax=Saccharopolyspora erythraea TaxID=1836 RepID=A4FQG2_SACEN|nr:DUF397 domain-containing protein [Saccharopolyspora erythraea]EQD86621.1 regulator [Saccharopolyspora erythraea D]PFG92888.1 uncharacterized protein DUF397 [Saccharopolyspora erythraea NRRL 2338]QRK89792.1 DUF397 domain-containing protein [Saccharopolyspora erythraea]CAM06287.1 putative regulator [Saccharopolyspora erythraea NRRL 2338]